MGIAGQVTTNLVHYNHWTDVHIHTSDKTNPADPLKFAVLSGLPPTKLNQLDQENQREWVIARLMADRTSDIKEMELYFQAIEALDSRPKRVTLALVNDDATVTHYFVHDGVTKPRQN